MKLHLIIYGLHSKLLDLRAIDRIISTTEFETIYTRTSEEKRTIVRELIEKVDKDGIIKWIRDHRILEEYTMEELRKLCSELGVPGYRNMTRLALISEIRGSNVAGTIQGNERAYA